MKAHIIFLIVLLVALMPATTSPVDTVAATASTCPQIVANAWDNLATLCDAAGRNEACYGHILLDAQPQPHVTDFAFSEEGHVVDVVDLQSLRLSGMDEANGTWGVSLLRIQANLPSSAADNVSLLMFGDVALKNAAVSVTTVEVTPDTHVNLNVRYRPSPDSPVVDTVAPGDVVNATGQLVDGSWLRIQRPGGAGIGWVSADLMKAAGSDGIDTLDVVDPWSPYYGPMQAFYYESGKDDALCPEAPDSGLLIQTPEGMAEITLLINEVDIQLGSTVFFQAQPGEMMSISTLEGHARVTAQGQSYTAVAGTRVTVPIGEDMTPTGPPTMPEAYAMDDLRGLPVGQLARPVEVHAPLTEDELAAEVQQQQNPPSPEDEEADPSGNPDDPAATGDLTVGTTETTDSGDSDELPPGLVDNPGLGDNLPPGQGGSAPPGQAKKDEE